MRLGQTMEQAKGPSRRSLIQGALATAAAVLLPREVDAQAGAPAAKPIPSTGEPLPVVCLGIWITFNVGNDPKLKDECTAVMAALWARRASGCTRVVAVSCWPWLGA